MDKIHSFCTFGSDALPPYRTGIRFPRKGDLCPFQHGPPLELPSFTGTELPAAFQAWSWSLMAHGAP